MSGVGAAPVLEAVRPLIEPAYHISEECSITSCRLSFKDVCKRLSELPETDGAFMGKKADKVERFVVVHGQVILNQVSCSNLNQNWEI